MSSVKLTISEINHIFNELNSISNFDFFDYSLSFKKHRIELIMKDENIPSAEDFVFRLNKSEKFVSNFLKYLFIPQSELFRDTEVWNYLYEKIFPKLLLKKDLKIHLPYCTNGEDLYSLMFFLGSFKSDSVSILISHPLQENKNMITSRVFDQKDLKNCVKNIELLSADLNPEDVFFGQREKLKMRHLYTGKLMFDQNIPEKSFHVSDFDMVFFRNRLIYYNDVLQEDVLNKISASLKKGGYLIIGERETLGHLSGKFKQIQSGLSIYKKRIF